MYSGSAQGVVERVINVRYYYYYYCAWYPVDLTSPKHISFTIHQRLMCSMKYKVCCVGFFKKCLTETCGLRIRALWY